MWKTACLLSVVALSINLVDSWDIAITTGDQLEFYTNKTRTGHEGVRFRDLTALAYDAVHNILLFVDKQNDNASIFSYNINTKKYRPLVGKRSYENIQGLAFDPVSGTLFWTDTNERSIYWISLKPGSKNDIYGNLLVKMNDEIPRDVAVDSCRGYIYWSNTNISKPTIERSRFDGSERMKIIDTDIYMPVSIAVDQRTKRLYWADDKEGIHFSIESSDLEGKDRKTLLAGSHHQPNALTVSNDLIYWVDWAYKSVWKISKNSTSEDEVEPDEVVNFNTKLPFGIVANYRITDQTEGSSECEELINISQNNNAFNDSFTIMHDVGLFCLHGVKLDGKQACKCSRGYIGERCEISVCQNYCFQGDCSLTTDGQPMCRCNTGFTGSRCENNVCSDIYCFNGGICKLDKEHNPTCSCTKEYEGNRCESKIVNTSSVSINTNATCNCTEDLSTRKSSAIFSSSYVPSDGEFIDTSYCNDGWDPVRDPVIIVLASLCLLLFTTCAFLIIKVKNLKKRPRIKKRIIVNKNVTPLTARPDHCEITIENCCNMNICETPCFEPRTTIRPTLLDAKPGKEEKKNLIANMEHPEDLY